MRARRTTAALAALVAAGLVTGCGGSDSDRPTGCFGDADGGTVVVQGASTVIAENVSAGVGSIDIDPDKATAIVTLSEGENPAAVRSIVVTVGTTFPAAGQELAVAQICRGSVTIDAAG
ncbi:hypothetical protein [Mumia zhuanghuii]|uniref:Uncharacterized protein n=1 Tax=Mumia zhuanghuii TaxID=2585211 RepID=A0A5C4MXL8_9ACTN|nr:hypothetical protein [Mumia zhuanghuii]TNC49497.1 hypothetical protein FHE65_05300 [Mumia zhuanghuii]TNC49661.1 hypothetical protein FHE65_05120 [Mumia zhuanghuii]